MIFLSLTLGISAQTHTHIYNERVRTLRVARTCLMLMENELDGSDPENVLHISFDEMSHDVHFYTFSVKHMNANWSKESDILSGEYLRGFTTQDITDYEHSINTSREYTHYRFAFPNPEMVITKSGNYLLTVYEDGDPENKIAEIRCSVVEPAVKVEANVYSHTDIEINGRYQQMDLSLNTAAIDLKDPNEMHVLVQQNNRTDNEVWLSRPTYIERNRLKYQQCKDLIFEGGNEYRHFDAFSTYFAGTGIDRVYYEMGDYHAMLFADELRTNGYMFNSADADGRFLVNAERTQDSDVEAEYMWVHWTLPMEQPWFDGALYVGGDLFNNEMGLRNRMQYDPETKCYWLASLVKQGGYDYQYWFVPKSEISNLHTAKQIVRPEGDKKSEISNNKTTTTQRVDGSYWQTENEYAVYVYWRPFGARYDRLVGVSFLR